MILDSFLLESVVSRTAAAVGNRVFAQHHKSYSSAQLAAAAFRSNYFLKLSGSGTARKAAGVPVQQHQHRRIGGSS